jgi:hypothetical protein
VATASDALCTPKAAHHSSPQKIAPSPIRSQVASSTPPKRVPKPRSRAMAPSSMSARQKTNTANAPHQSCPIGNSVSAAMTVPAVPMMVMLSGVSPVQSAALATGLLSLV